MLHTDICELSNTHYSVSNACTGAEPLGTMTSGQHNPENCKHMGDKICSLLQLKLNTQHIWLKILVNTARA